MNAKTITVGLIIALVTALLAAGFTVAGTYWLHADKSNQSNPLTGLFKSSKPEPIKFAEVKNILITLKGTGNAERYLLLDLNLEARGEGSDQTVQDMTPAIRGATVSLLSGMDYDNVRALSVKQLCEKLKTAYIAKFKSLKRDVPFTDVIISKMVFQ